VHFPHPGSTIVAFVDYIERRLMYCGNSRRKDAMETGLASAPELATRRTLYDCASPRTGDGRSLPRVDFYGDPSIERR
jgi:hypothetical protein